MRNCFSIRRYLEWEVILHEFDGQNIERFALCCVKPGGFSAYFTQ